LAKLFLQKISRIPTETLMVCHPATGDTTAVADPLARVRRAEFNYLVSDDFLADCAEVGLGVVQN
jgi:hypothetical protein